MKKFFVVALGVVLGFALVGSAYAIDGASLESQTTEGLYDRHDAFDITLRPGLLYQVDRWRLYTNLSAYEGFTTKQDQDSQAESYLIGTSGRLGPGSAAFLYEYFDDEYTPKYQTTNYYEEEDTTGDYPNYDGRWDYRSDGANNWNYDTKLEQNNFYASYSMDFDGFSLGLSYAPEFTDESNTFGISESGPDSWSDLNNPTNWWSSSWGCDMYFPSGNSNYYTMFHSIDYDGDGDEYDSWDEFTASTSWRGKQDRETDYHPIYLESHVHTADNWHLLAGVGYADVQVDTDFRGHLDEHWVAKGGVGEGSNSRVTWDRQIDVQGVIGNWGFYDADLDGDRWWLYLEPVYEVNDIVTLRCDLTYATEDGDMNTWDGVSGTLDASYVTQATGADDHTWTAHDTFDCSSSGDYSTDEWEIEPRVYFNYDPVRFSLGVGYHYEKSEWSGNTNTMKSSRWTYDDGDNEADDPNDWVFTSSWTEHETFDGEEKYTTWRFPVAAEFDITEKLTIRAGACYYLEDYEYDEQGVEVGRNDEKYLLKYGDDSPSSPHRSTGPEDYYSTDTDIVSSPYDQDKEGDTWRDQEDGTENRVTYQIGLGYYFTENLQLDLMWRRSSYDHVDFDNLYTSITLAF